MANVVVSAIATFNGKALKKGQKDISAFDKQAQQLGKTFSRVFATTAIVAFSRKAINAFMSDEAAAKSLAVQLENTGNAFRVGEVESYIASTQKLYKVLDDKLRPAFQTLLNATGSVTLSQKALETALNVSAGTGASLETVISAIAAGVRGQTKAIKGLNTGIDANIIASGDMNKIMAALEKRFTGAALARLDTYAGKMDALKVASADATEIIGAGLLDALTALGKDNSIDQAANSMNGFAIAIANTAKGMGELIAQVKQMIDSDVGKFLLGLTALLTLGKKQLIVGAAGLIAYDIGKTQTAAPGSGTARVKDYNITTKLFKARNEEYKIIAAKNAIDNKNLEELKKKFDLERIGLTAALNNATDEETKLRLRAQLAILDNNEALAKKILAEMEAAEALRKLKDAADKLTLTFEQQMEVLRASIGSIFNSIKPELKSIQTLTNPTQENLRASIGAILESTKPIQTQLNSIINPSEENLRASIGSIFESAKPALDMLNLITSGAIQRTSSSSPTDIRLTIDAGNDRMSQAIAESIQVATRSGYSTVPNGFLV